LDAFSVDESAYHNGFVARSNLVLFEKFIRQKIGGYSGSPVFLWLPPMTYRPEAGMSMNWHYRFLGIDWCHINDYVVARDKSGAFLEFEIMSNSGMMGVISELEAAGVFRDRIRARKTPRARGSYHESGRSALG
jgi:hypothetical protein